MSTRRRTVFYLQPAGKDKLYLLLVITLATWSCLLCVSTARREECMVNWKTFSLCHFAKVSHRENVFELTSVVLS